MGIPKDTRRSRADSTIIARTLLGKVPMYNSSSRSPVGHTNRVASRAYKTTFKLPAARGCEAIWTVSRSLPEEALDAARQLRTAWVHRTLGRAWQWRYRALVLCVEGMLTSFAYVFSAA